MTCHVILGLEDGLPDVNFGAEKYHAGVFRTFKKTP